MSAVLVEKAPAKINLTLRVLGRRADGYHVLESLVVFADFADRLSLAAGGEAALEVTGPFAGKSGAVGDNLVLKAVTALRERVPALKAGRFTLEKNIPVAAGVGGGSADAAAALRLLANTNGLSLNDPRVRDAALGVGADVPVCLESRARVMRGVGEELLPPLDLPPFPALLVNPNVPLATRDVFAGRSGAFSDASHDEVPVDFDGLIDWLTANGNDLAEPAIACVPVIADVLKTLSALPGARLSRMSGSGPTCFALFASSEEAAVAGRALRAQRGAWWVQVTTLR